MFDAPTFNIPLGSEVSGDDPLGLAPVNERLYGSVFPGINNVVRYILIYALLCWAAWRVEEHLRKQAKCLTTMEVTDLFESMQEKVELLVTWANVGREDVTGLVGTRRKFPEDDRRVTMRFETFGTNEAAYMAAVQYGPSITNGLGFLEARAHDTFGCTESGKQLAEALDHSLRASPHYKWLSDVTGLSARRSQVMALRPLLDVLQPRKIQQQVFLSRLIPECVDGEDKSLDANRRSGMQLALRAIESVNAWNGRRKRASTGASEDEVRAAMSRGCSPDGRQFDLSGVELAQAKWAVLQLRQYQRACFEAFYVGLEFVLSGQVDILDRSKAGVAAFMGRLCEEAFEGKRKPLVRHIEEAVRESQGDSSSLFRAALKEVKADVFECRYRLLDTEIEVMDGNRMPLLAEAAQGLVFCSVEAGNLASDPRMRPYLRLDEDKIPLSKMPELVAKFGARPIKELAAHIVRHNVIARHYEIVALRSRQGDEKNRFRFVESDTGLRRYDDSRGLPGLTEARDRLARVLDLLEQSSLLEQDNSGYVVTKRGRGYLGA
jgi:hypothetical protein